MSVSHLQGFPEYPVAALCGPLSDFVVQVSGNGLSAAFAGGAGLSALATMAGKARLETLSDRRPVPPILWVPLLGTTGSGKSPAIDKAVMRVEYLDNLDQQQRRIDRENGKDVRRDGSLLVDDVTVEQLAYHLHDGAGYAGIITPELTGFLGSMSRYQSGGSSNEHVWLKRWDGAHWRYQRRGDRGNGVDLYIESPAITVCGGLQHSEIDKLGENERGFRARWLPHYESPSFKPSNGSPVNFAEWHATADLLYNAREDRLWHLEGSSYRLWSEATRRWRAEADKADNTALYNALLKADQQAARIALVLAESIEPGKGGPIPPEAMESAIAIVDYCMAVWSALGDGTTAALSTAEQRSIQLAEKIREWLDRKGGSRTAREILRANVGGIKTMSLLTTVLDVYEEMYPGTIVTEKRGATDDKLTVIVSPPEREGYPTTPTTPTTSPTWENVPDNVPDNDPTTGFGGYPVAA
jgi:hypothetical protein